MPTPVFIVAAQSCSEDSRTGSISYFHILDKLTLQRFSGDTAMALSLIVPTCEVVLSATWMRDPGDDPEQEYEYDSYAELRGTPSVDQSAPAAKGRLEGAKGVCKIVKQFHRFNFIYRLPPIPQPGMLWLYSRLKKRGESDWQVQKYPLVVEFIDPPKPHDG